MGWWQEKQEEGEEDEELLRAGRIDVFTVSLWMCIANYYLACESSEAIWCRRSLDVDDEQGDFSFGGEAAEWIGVAGVVVEWALTAQH